METYQRQITKHLPASLLRRGYFIILFCLGIVGFLSSYIEFKENLKGDIVFTSETFPVEVFNSESGRLRLLKNEGEEVEAGEILGYLETEVKYQDLLALENQVHQLEPLSLLPYPSGSLGEIGPILLEYNRSVQEYDAFRKNDRSTSMIDSKKRSIDLLLQRIKLLEEQVGLRRTNQSIAQRRLEANERLNQDSVVANLKLDEFKESLNERSLDALSQEGIINDYKVQVELLQQEIYALDENRNKTLQNLNAYCEQQFNLLKQQIRDWKKSFLLISEMDGICVLQDVMLNGEFINQGTKIMTVTPTKTKTIRALIQLPIVRSGKVKLNQEVYVRVDNYPYEDYGIIKGRVIHMAKLPNDANFYNVQVDFPNGLISTYDIEFTFQQMMQGKAEIIIDRKSIVESILAQLKSEWLNR